MRRATLLFVLLLPAPMPVVAQATGEGTTQEATPVEHQVQPGETLWSISRAYFGNPFQWRAILEANEDRIEHPNWIEPGLVLLIPRGLPEGAPGSAPGSAPKAAAPAAEDQASAAVQAIQVTTVPRRAAVPEARTDADERRAADAPTSERRPPTSPYGARTIFYTDGAQGGTTGVSRTAGSRVADVAVIRTAVPRDVYYAAGWLVPIDGPYGASGRVEGFASDARGRAADRWAALPYDELLLELDGPSPEVGDRFTTFRLGREIEHLGRVAVPTGIVTVTRVNAAGAVGVLSDEYGSVQTGDLLAPLAPYPLVGGVSATPATRRLVSRVLTFQEPHLVKSLGAVAFIDLGRDSGVSVGDEFAVYSAGRADAAPESLGSPVGRLQVVGVHQDHLSARVVDVTGPLSGPGLLVRLVAEMP